MPGRADGSGKPGVSWEPEDLTPGAGPEEARKASVEPLDEDLFAATEDPARFLKEPGSE
ncbi:MAG: hypothetical protein ACR2HO_09675 [Rubrobacteraceae bacterium]|nr:hypothetical protein [Rubrobacter sp.]